MTGRSPNSEGEPLTFSATMRPPKVGLPKKVEYYRLHRPVQDRFAAATRRTAPPAPILFRPASRSVVWGLLVGSGLLVLASLLVLRAGWGDVASGAALHGARMLILDLALWIGAAYGVVHAMARLRALDALPYRAGTYVFPGCVVEALGPVLRVWPAAEAETVERIAGPSPGLALKMRDGTRVVVSAATPEIAERAERSLLGVRAQLLKAVAEDDAHTLAEMDPLHDAAMSSPIGPSEPMVYRVATWIRFDWAIAAGIGAVLGLVLVEGRNALSDEAMYRSVAADGTAAAFEAYLAQNGRHSAEVRDVLLPRVQLRDAEASGSVDAVQTFAQAHAGSKIQPEIDAAMRRLLLVELDRAKKAGTVGALDAFSARFPSGGVQAELTAARHALYAQALAAWKKKANPDAGTSAFMDRLLAAVEKTGRPTCELRFHLLPFKTLDDADERTKKSGHYAGPDALPSKYITVDAMRAREARVATDLVTGMAAELPADVLTLKAGAPLEGDTPSLTNAETPTLFVTYSVEWSHVSSLSLRPPTVFSGMNFTFDAEFVLADGAPLSIKAKAWKGAELWRIKADGLSFVEFTQKVYDAMTDGAFDLLSKRLSDTLL